MISPKLHVQRSTYKLMVVAYMNGLVQDCSNSIANALESLQSDAKPSILHSQYSHLAWGDHRWSCQSKSM